MLLSMTGFGESHCQENGLAVSVEVRTINTAISNSPCDPPKVTPRWSRLSKKPFAA